MGSNGVELKILSTISAAHISIFSQLRESFEGRDRKAWYRPVFFCSSGIGFLARARDIP